MAEINANWKHPHQAEELARRLYNDKSLNYAEFAVILRENLVSIEDRIALMEKRIDDLWAEVFP